jgi:hypothetical protein
LEGDKLQIEETLSLSTVRRMQEAYLKEYPNSPGSRGSFGMPLPPVELNRLGVVAWIQDDSDRTVWDAILVPVH